MFPEEAPLFQCSCRERLQNHVVPSSSVRLRASSSTHASIRTCFESTSWTTAGSSPRSSYVSAVGSTRPSLRGEVVWIGVGDVLDPVLGDQDGVLQPNRADPVEVEARLDRDDVAGDQLVGSTPHRGVVVHLQPDAVPQRMRESLLDGSLVLLV